MKIYRCRLCYNNADTCEWENWYECTSEWYSERSLAERHLPRFKEFLKHLKRDVFTDYPEDFKYRGPFVEEAEVHDDFVPMEPKSIFDV